MYRNYWIIQYLDGGKWYWPFATEGWTFATRSDARRGMKDVKCDHQPTRIVRVEVPA